MPRLTKRSVESLQPQPRDFTVWDDELPGFGVRVWPSSRRVYILKYRTAEGRQRKPVLGVHGAITAEEARRKARIWLGLASDGDDPSGDRQEARKAPTVAEVAERYMAEHAEAKKKPLSIREDRRMLDRLVLPALGTRKITEIERSDIGRLHNDYRGTPYQANRALALLSKMFALAEQWGLRPENSNPCRHVEKFREKKREKFLSKEELARLGAALGQLHRSGSETPAALAAIGLLIFTGARVSEILTLRWEHVDFERGCLNLPDSKTGAKTIQLNAPAIKILTGLVRSTDNPHVIPGSLPGARLFDLKGPWQRVRARADLPDLRLHDLRHSFASVAVSGGMSLPMIGALLGHRTVSTTARYAHLAADPVKQANDLVGARLAKALRAERSA